VLICGRYKVTRSVLDGIGIICPVRRRVRRDIVGSGSGGRRISQWNRRMPFGLSRRFLQRNCGRKLFWRWWWPGLFHRFRTGPCGDWNGRMVVLLVLLVGLPQGWRMIVGSLVLRFELKYVRPMEAQITLVSKMNYSLSLICSHFVFWRIHISTTNIGPHGSNCWLWYHHR